ncbi:MAG: protein kinase [Polyangiaceae bacterium]|nr:protein kinase [Polyangiaceae bacterium]
MFPQEPVPDTIGAYKVIRRLAGTGGVRVYLARMEGPLGFQRTCALKLVPNTAEGDARLAQELAREATICAQLNHPVIVRMFDFFERGDKLVLVLEHVEGASLDRLLRHLAKRGQRLGDAAAYHVVQRIAGALVHAHATRDEHGALTPVIHRNLHPESILIGWDGQVRLTGFGMAKILGRTPDTVMGADRGAAGYVAPEIVRGERPTPKADVYGLGILLWSLLTGKRPPFDKTRPAPLATLRPDVARPIAAMVDAALASFPEARAMTCQEIEETIAKLGRADEGKAELVLRIQSAHSSLELEETDVAEVKRPTVRIAAQSHPSLPDDAEDEGPAGEAGRSPEHPDRAPVTMPPEEVVLEDAPPSGAEAGAARRLAAAGSDDEVSFSGLADAGFRVPSPPGLPGGVPTSVPRFGTAPPLPGPAPEIVVGPWEDPLGTPTPGAASITFGAPPALPGTPPGVVRPAGAREARGAQRYLTPLTVIVISASTATVVAAVWLYLAYRDPATPAPAAASAEPVAPPSAAPPPAPPELPTAAPDASAPPAAVDPATLPAGFGYLTVTSQGPANVHVNGKLAGPANQPLQVRCGRWFVRLARPGESRYPDWVSAGSTVTVPCQGATTVDMKAAPGR